MCDAWKSLLDNNALRRNSGKLFKSVQQIKYNIYTRPPISPKKSKRPYVCLSVNVIDWFNPKVNDINR